VEDLLKQKEEKEREVVENNRDRVCEKK